MECDRIYDKYIAEQTKGRVKDNVISAQDIHIGSLERDLRACNRRQVGLKIKNTFITIGVGIGVFAIGYSIGSNVR